MKSKSQVKKTPVEKLPTVEGTTMPLEALRSYLGSQPPGALAEDEQLETLLVSGWDELDGSADGGMESHKLKGRMESATWNPPILCFQIERHGGTVNGSVYAELQRWEINCEKRIAITISSTPRNAK
jgi:hypothetical protein